MTSIAHPSQDVLARAWEGSRHLLLNDGDAKVSRAIVNLDSLRRPRCRSYDGVDPSAEAFDSELLKASFR